MSFFLIKNYPACTVDEHAPKFAHHIIQVYYFAGISLHVSGVYIVIKSVQTLAALDGRITF